MGLGEEFDGAINATRGIGLTENLDICKVNLFESTIRILGGLISVYDLSNDVRLIPKLTEIGTLLSSAFRTPNGMPCTHCNLGQVDAQLTPPSNAPLAEVATLGLEFARLSQITGDRKYMKVADFLSNVLARTQHQSGIPGLWPEEVDPSSVSGSRPKFAHRSLRWSLGAGADSAYEYLLRGHLLLGQQRYVYKSMWKTASSQIKEQLLFRPAIPNTNGTGVLFTGSVIKVRDRNHTLLETKVQHLACFAGGMFAMASRIFNNPEDLKVAEQITNGCVWSYRNSLTGIMPEAFSVMQCPSKDRRKCSDVFQEREK